MLKPLAGVLDLGDGSAKERARRELSAIRGKECAQVDAGPLLAAAGGGIGGRGDVLCAIDGTVHNHKELAEDLSLSHETPPEAVLAAGFRHWDLDLAPRVRGEFSALLWDRERHRGILLCDRLATRRLFLRSDGQRLWFGSEIRDVLALLATRPAPDTVAISHWLTRTSPPEGRTFYEGITGVPWGHLVLLEGSGWSLRRFWLPRYEPPVVRGRTELVAEVDTLLKAAVGRRVPDSEPVGILMSGGLDSTSVAALASKSSPRGAVGFAATFPDYPSIDESGWMDAMEHAGIETVRRPTAGPGIVSTGLDFLLHWEVPLHIWGDAWFQPLLSEAAQRGIKVMLDGDGGDEVFGSRLYLVADLLAKGRIFSAARLARGLPEFGGRAPKRVFAELLWRYGLLGIPSPSLETAWARLTRRSPAPWWASDMCKHQARPTGSSWKDADGPRWWRHAAYAMTEAPHSFGLLDHIRRRAEQVGLESSHPLYDADLCDFMLGVPPEESSRGQLSRPLFREAMEGVSPDQVRLRPGKSRFDAVVVDALLGPELPVIREVLGGSGDIAPYVQPGSVDKLLAYEPSGTGEPPAIWASHIIRLTALSVWFRFQEDRAFPEHLREKLDVPRP
jgi:asparagine synthase (glutamine-hydrolysing)